MSTPSQTLRRVDLTSYSVLALPLAFIGMPLYIHAPDFYVTQTSLSLWAIGTALLFIRLFDAIQDPIIGFFCDRFFAYRRRIIIASVIGLSLGFWMLFHPLKTNPLIWFCASLILAKTCFSVLTILLNASGSLWSQDDDTKTRITTWREGFGLVGLLIAAILPTVLGFDILSYTLPVLLVIGAFFLLTWQKKTVLIKKPSAAKQAWRLCFLAPFPLFYALCGLSMLASAIPAALVIFYIRDYLGAEHLTGLFLLLYFLSGALGMPIWRKIAHRYGALETLLAAMILSVIMFIGAFTLERGDIWLYGLICILSGFALGAELSLPPSILSRMIDRTEQQAQTSLHFSILAFFSKLSLAAGSGIALIILGWNAFQPNSVNTTQALESLSFTYALLPCLIKIAAAALLFGSLTRLKQGDTKCVTLSSHSAWEPL